MIDLAFEHKQLDVGDLMDQIHSVAVSYIDSQTTNGESNDEHLGICYKLLIEEFISLDGHLNAFLLGIFDSCPSEDL